jgi:DNA-directed RNA polymerase subunit H
MDSNSTISKINRSRYNLKQYLSKEWNIDDIKDYSDIEIEKLYRTSKPTSSEIYFGNASACNFTLYHKRIPSHRLHVIYYNFPELGSYAVKITKTCSEKLNALYKEGDIQPEDSLIVILYNQVSENLRTSIEGLYKLGQEELKINGLSENIQKENESLGDLKYNQEHFRNIHIYHLDSLSIDITKHVNVPEHIAIRDKQTIDETLEKCNCRIDQLPIILRTDAMAKRIRLAPGDICKINRITPSAGDVVYYRVCK